jgi:hypothetical protein
MEGGDLDTAQNEFALALSASPRYFQAAQDNLDLVGKRIAEREMTVAPVAASVPATSSLPPGSATAVAGLAAGNAMPSYSYSGAQRKPRSGKDAQLSSKAASCYGAAATKPRCNPYAIKQSKPYKPYRVASSKRPKT